MSIFAEAYSRYLTTSFNYDYRYKLFQKLFKNSITSITDPNFITKTLLDSISDFPKYPPFFKIFAKTDNINLVKIYNTTLDNTDDLINSIRNFDILNYKHLYDSVPSTLSELVGEVNFQFSYINSLEDFYNYNKIVTSFISDSSYRNFYTELYSPLFYSSEQTEGDTIGFEDGSFLYQYLLYCGLYNIISTSHNINHKLTAYMVQINHYEEVADCVNSSRQILDFQSFITDYNSVISVDISKIISKIIYEFQNVSPLLLTNLNYIVSSNLDNISTAFENFLTSNVITNYSELLSNYFTAQFNASLSLEMLCKIFNDDDVVDQTSSSTQHSYENDQFANYMDILDENNLKDYLFLAFLYKFWPIKFLNVMQLILKQYVEDIIKPPTSELFTTAEYMETVAKLFFENHVDYDNLYTKLNDEICPIPELIEFQTELEVGVEFEPEIEFDDPDDELEEDIEFEPRIAFETALGRYTFTTNSSVVECYDVNSYNAVNVGDYIYAYGDNKTSAGHVISKEVSTLILNLEQEYSGTDETADNLAYIYQFSTSEIYTSLIETRSISKFASMMFNIYVLDNFFISEEYTSFIQTLTESIFIYLRNNGHVDYTYDWYEYHTVIDIYFKEFLRWKLIDQSHRAVLPNYKNGGYKFEFNSNVVQCLDKSSYDLIIDNDYIFSETDNIQYAQQVISHEIVSGEYFLNLSDSYSGTTTKNLFESAYIYNTSDKLLFSTFSDNFDSIVSKLVTNTTNNPLYDIYFKIISESQIQTNMSFISNSLIYNIGMHQFTENLILSILTREIIYSVISDFVV
jgi:hypothetical protein